MGFPQFLLVLGKSLNGYSYSFPHRLTPSVTVTLPFNAIQARQLKVSLNKLIMEVYWWCHDPASFTLHARIQNLPKCVICIDCKHAEKHFSGEFEVVFKSIVFLFVSQNRNLSPTTHLNCVACFANKNISHILILCFNFHDEMLTTLPNNYHFSHHGHKMLKQKTLLIGDLLSRKQQNKCNFAAFMSLIGKDLLF